jgi:molybdopterin converting factor subunit 1
MTDVRLPALRRAVYRAQPAPVAPAARTMTRIRIEYFAILREQAGRAAEEIDTAATTAAELYAEIEARYRFAPLPSLKVAINDEFRDWESRLAEGDLVVFIPPVAGG